MRSSWICTVGFVRVRQQFDCFLQSSCLIRNTFSLHRASNVADFVGSQVTIVATLQVDADFGSCLHLETVHSLTCLGNIDLVAVLHTKISPLLSSDENTFRRKHFLFRGHSLAKVGICMNGVWRKEWWIMEWLVLQKLYLQMKH